MSWCPWEVEALDPLELQIITAPHGYWESNHGILEESYVLISAEPSPSHFSGTRDGTQVHHRH